MTYAEPGSRRHGRGTHGHRLPTFDRRTFVVVFGALVAWLAGCAPSATGPLPAQKVGGPSGPHDLLEVIARRRSVRKFVEAPFAAEHIRTMLRAAQGVTDAGRGFRAAPSAGALYPLHVYVATAEGIGRYQPDDDELEWIGEGDVRRELAAASLGQAFVADAPVVFAVTGVYARTAVKYGERAARYVHLEAGHATQNLLLAAEYLGLRGVPVGAFSDAAVRSALQAGDDEMPLYVIPVGYPRK